MRHLLLEPHGVQGVADGQAHVVEAVGLVDEIVGALAQRGDGVGHGAVAGHDDHAARLALAVELGQGVQARHARQAQVQQGQVHPLAGAHLLQGRLAAGRGEHLAPRALEVEVEQLARVLVVVHHQDARRAAQAFGDEAAGVLLQACAHDG